MTMRPCDPSQHASYTTPWGIGVVVNREILPRFRLACERAASEKWRPRRIDSYVCRPVRGRVTPSRHAYAAAWDFFVTLPGVEPPGGIWTPEDPVPPEFARHFERLGFRWGRRFPRRDDPHIEWPTNNVPPLSKAGSDEGWERLQTPHDP
ncbi:MAG: M15 family metallopeptidase [Acidimicrobiia bacterium]